MNEKKQIIIIVGLLVMLILIWIFVLQPPKKNPDKINVLEENGLEFKIVLDMADKYFKDKEDVQEFSYEENKDPFSMERRKVIGEKEIAPGFFKELTLKGILWDSQRPIAIINGEVVRKGSIIKGMEIKSIEPDRVILEVEGEEKVLFIEGVKNIERKEDKNPKMEGVKNEEIAPVSIR